MSILVLSGILIFLLQRLNQQFLRCITKNNTITTKKNLLEMQITGYQPRSTESEALKVELKNLHHKLSKWFWSISSLRCTGLKLCYAILYCWQCICGLTLRSRFAKSKDKNASRNKRKASLFSGFKRNSHMFSFSIWFHVLHLLYLSFVWTLSWSTVWEIHFHLFGYSVVVTSLHISYTYLTQRSCSKFLLLM